MGNWEIEENKEMPDLEQAIADGAYNPSGILEQKLATAGGCAQKLFAGYGEEQESQPDLSEGRRWSDRFFRRD